MNEQNSMTKLSEYKAPSSHILKGQLLYGADFEKYVPELMENTREKFNIRDVTASLTHLRIIDAKLAETPLEILITPHLFSSLVAYIGEIIIRHAGGKWQMVNLKNDRTVWMPYIIGNKKLFNPFYPVYEKLIEKRNVDLYDDVMIEISK